MPPIYSLIHHAAIRDKGTGEFMGKYFASPGGMAMFLVFLTVSIGMASQAVCMAETSSLEFQIDSHIKKLRAEGKISSQEKTSWSVYDFTLGRKWVSINEDVPRQGASLIKPFLALAFFHRVKEGQLIYGSKSRARMSAMIQYSNNTDTNWVMQHAGGPEGVQEILTNHYPSIFKETQIVEYIPGGGRTYKNMASAHDYCRFLRALWNEELPHFSEIQRIMALPNKDRCVWGVSCIPKGTLVYDKTGSTSMLCGQMAIIVPKGKDGREYPYTYIAIVERETRADDYGAWISARANLLREVSAIVYMEIARIHGLQVMETSRQEHPEHICLATLFPESSRAIVPFLEPSP